MYYKITVKLTSQFLGSSKPDKNHIRRIARNQSKNPLLFTKAIHDLVNQYITNKLGMPEAANSLKFQSVIFIDPEKTNPVVHERRFINKSSGLEESEYFEALPVGTEAVLKCSTDESMLPFTTFTKVINYLESKASISQFGKHWGYGKFIVTDIQLDANTLPTLEDLDEMVEISKDTGGNEAAPEIFGGE